MDENNHNTRSSQSSDNMEKGNSTPNSSRSTTEIDKSVTPAAKEEESMHGLEEPKEDINIVDWDGPNDPSNPRNWDPSRKWTIISILSIVTFNVSLATTILAPAVPSVTTEFHTTNSAISTLLVSIYIIGLATGPLFLAPFSELYGRVWVSHISNVIFTVASIFGAVSVNAAMLIIFRFLMGMASGVPATVGGGYITDLMAPEERGKAYAIWVIGPLLGPVLAPMLGGFISMGIGWRWTLWIPAITGGISTTVSFFIMKETYGPRILATKTQNLRKSTGNALLRSKFQTEQTPSQLFRLAIIRPVKLFTRSPIVCLLTLFASITYSYFYLLFTTFTPIFEGDYGFNVGEAGMAYLGMGVGFCIAQISVGFLSDRYVVRQKEKRKGTTKPEDRLPPLILGSFLVPIGLLWFGWSVKFRVHWILPIIGTGFCGLGIYFVLIPIQMYLIDAFPLYAASAIAANVVVRSIFGTVIPLAGPALFARLGLGWGSTLLAFLALIFAPCSIFFLKYGEAIRENSRYQPNL